MDSRNNKNTKKSYFNSPKKQPLVKKMIFDPHQVQVPLSCFELRPIHESESNQQQIFYDSKSSSLRQISEFEKNSLHEFDRMIYEHKENSNQSDSSYIDCNRGQNSAQFHFKIDEESLSESQSYRPQKRENPISHEQTKRYENIGKIVQVSQTYDQSTIKKQEHNDHQNLLQNPQSFHSPVRRPKATLNNWITFAKSQKKPKWPSTTINSSIHADQIFTQDMQDDHYLSSEELQQNHPTKKQQKTITNRYDVKIEEISSQLNHINSYFASQKKTIRKKIDNPQFQLINQYMELASYAALIDQMILVYDKSPLFQLSLDFDSETDNYSDEEQQPQKNRSLQVHKSDKPQNQMQPEDQVKIQHIENQINSNNQRNTQKICQNISKSEKELYTEFEKMKIQEAVDEKDKQKIIKEINFNRSKTFYNFYQPIKQLKPYMKKMTIQEKKLFLAFKKELKEIKDIIDYFQRKTQGDKKEHICKLCGEEFESGRQLGGHMSRKHPGKAIEYGYKKELHKVKEIERNRRKYFKELEDVVKNENKEN